METDLENFARTPKEKVSSDKCHVTLAHKHFNAIQDLFFFQFQAMKLLVFSPEIILKNCAPRTRVHIYFSQKKLTIDALSIYFLWPS